jgi:serine protease Do
MSKSKVRLLTSVCAVSVALLGAAVAWGEGRPADVVNPAATSPAPAGAPLSFAPLVQKVAPAVVSIEIVGHASPREVAMTQGGDDSQGQAMPFSFGAPFQQFFGGQPFFGGGFAPGRGEPDGQPLPKIHAAGSGFFISGDGYILTNNHVVEDADKITVHMNDGKTYAAHLVGRDPATDLAVVKVTGGPFPFVSFENAAKPRVGDWVVAVGNPFGLAGTATAGIVSALGRENVADSPLLDYMQIDAPINRGNSGGPTFDTEGRVVGVNTAIFTPSGGSVGIGFDIPASVASNISSQLIAHGHVSHGYLGATVQQITPDLAQSLGMTDEAGAIIDAVSPGGPAQKAGLRNGDVLVAINGQAVHSPHDITRIVAFSKPGARLTLNVRRGGGAETFEATAGVRPDEETLARQMEPQNDGTDGG